MRHKLENPGWLWKFLYESQPFIILLGFQELHKNYNLNLMKNEVSCCVLSHLSSTLHYCIYPETPVKLQFIFKSLERSNKKAVGSWPWWLSPRWQNSMKNDSQNLYHTRQITWVRVRNTLSENIIQFTIQRLIEYYWHSWYHDINERQNLFCCFSSLRLKKTN